VEEAQALQQVEKRPKRCRRPKRWTRPKRCSPIRGGGVELQNTQTKWTASGGVEGCFGSGMLPNRPMKYYPHMKARCQQKKERNASKKGFH